MIKNKQILEFDNEFTVKHSYKELVKTGQTDEETFRKLQLKPFLNIVVLPFSLSVIFLPWVLIWIYVNMLYTCIFANVMEYHKLFLNIVWTCFFVHLAAWWLFQFKVHT